MKTFLIFILALCQTVLATNYYVRTDGNDGNAGTADTAGGAWLTVDFALGASGVPLTGGPHTLNIRTGTYVSATYLHLGRSYGTMLTVQPTTGANDVTIMGTSGNFNVLQSAAISNLEFSKLTFTNYAGSTHTVSIYQYPSTNLIFTNCVFNSNGSGQSCVDYQGSSIGSNTYPVFGACTFNAYGTPLAAISVPNSSSAVFWNGTIDNCTINSEGPGVLLLAGTNYVTNSGFYSRHSGNKPFAFGTDGPTGQPCTGIVSNCVFKSELSHGCLLGAGATGVQLVNSIVYGGDDGLVIKKAANCVITGCTVFGGSGVNSTLLLKGADTCTVTNSIIVGCNSNRVLSNYDGDSTYKSANCSVVGNRVIAGGSSGLIYWQANGDNGGNVVNGNVYGTIQSGNWGTVGASSGLTTLANTIAAWAVFGYPNNDQQSRDVTNPVDVSATF